MAPWGWIPMWSETCRGNKNFRKNFNVFLINTEMCMGWLLLILIVSMHGSTMKLAPTSWQCTTYWVLSLQLYRQQKFLTATKRTLCLPNLAANGFWLFTKLSSSGRDEIFGTYRWAVQCQNIVLEMIGVLQTHHDMIITRKVYVYR